jgi:hypothetical protein
MPSLRFYAVIPLLKTVAQDSTPQRWKEEKKQR